MRWYRDFLGGAPEDFGIWAALQQVPPGDPFPREHWNKPVCLLVICHTGSKAEADVNSIRAALPKPIFDWCGLVPYPALQQMFALVYIDASIIPTDAQVFYKQIQEHDFEMAQPGWQADFNDASNFLDLFRTGGGNNWPAYSNPAFDRMLQSAQDDIDLVSRGKKLAAAEAIVLKDQAAMPIFFWVSGNLVRPYVKGWDANPLDKHRARWISIDEKARASLLIS